MSDKIIENLAPATAEVKWLLYRY